MHLSHQNQLKTQQNTNESPYVGRRCRQKAVFFAGAECHFLSTVSCLWRRQQPDSSPGSVTHWGHNAGGHPAWGAGHCRPAWGQASHPRHCWRSPARPASSPAATEPGRNKLLKKVFYNIFMKRCLISKHKQQNLPVFSGVLKLVLAARHMMYFMFKGKFAFGRKRLVVVNQYSFIISLYS